MSPPVLPMITAVNQRFNKTGSVEDLPRIGQPAKSFNRRKDLRYSGYQSMVIDSARLYSSTSRYHAVMQKLQLKPYHPTLIVDPNEDDFDRYSETCLEKNSIMIPVWLIIFFGATNVNLTETEQFIATIVSTGLLKVLMRNLAYHAQKKG